MTADDAGKPALCGARRGAHGIIKPCSCPLGCACETCGCGDPHLNRCRLPIYGERVIDFHLRGLRSTWQFGHWLLENMDDYEDLAHEIDEYEDTYTADVDGSVGNFEAAVSAADIDGDAGDAEDEEEDSPDDADGDDQEREYRESASRRLGLATVAFLTDKLTGLLSRRVSEDEIEHRCFGISLRLPPPLDAWPTESGVYYVRHAGGASVKIGHGTDISRRMSSAKCWSWEGIELLAWEPGAADLESQRHKEFEGLWLRPDDSAKRGSEWFKLEGAILEHICRLRGGISDNYKTEKTR